MIDLAQPSADLVMVQRIKRENPALYRKLLKLAKKARGNQPIRTDKGDAKRALTLLVGASGRQRRKAKKAIQRAMRAA